MTITINEILEQVKTLTPQQRRDLTKMLIDMLDDPQQPPAAAPEEYWGKALNRLMDEIGPIEMLYPEIEDPVEWVKYLRAEQRRRRLGDWGQPAV